MTAAEFIGSLESVRARGLNKWSAKCPGHADKAPSLTIAEGDKGLLVKCWAGCSLEEITGALGIKVSDLFFDALSTDPHQRREAARRRAHEQRIRERHAHQQGALIDCLREGDHFIQSRRGLDIRGWSDEKLNKELDALADAYHLLETEALHG
ncbi:MAG TPA: hypothetical protein VGQ08_13265 [Nitrospiraceae bacterium]|jgi:hypothetical protein|nr:hypothetical protein [Nitrospiraceae bacterium]